MSKPRKFLRIVVGNILVFFAILWAINLLAAALLDSQYTLEQALVPVSSKARRPSLEDREKATAVFREFSLLRTRYVPFVAWSRLPFEGRYTTVNAEGDRVHPPTTANPKGHVRFFGGSTIWCKGVADEETIPAQFNALYPELRVHNHGESAFVSRQGVARLTNLVNQDEPMDVVFFYDGCNDVYRLCRDESTLNGHARGDSIAARVKPASHIFNALAGPIWEVTQFVAGVLELAPEPESLCATVPGHAEKVARTLVNNWRIAKALAEARGAEFHAALQPVAAVGSPNIEYLGEKTSQRSQDRRQISALVGQIIEAENADWLHDFSDAFDRPEYIYIDGCHVNPLGNQIIAERFSEVAKQALQRLR